MSRESLKEAIANHGIERTLEVCIEMIESGYLDSCYPPLDRNLIKAGIKAPVIYMREFATPVPLEEIYSP
jgi:hypothetical protein